MKKATKSNSVTNATKSANGAPTMPQAETFAKKYGKGTIEITDQAGDAFIAAVQLEQSAIARITEQVKAIASKSGIQIGNPETLSGGKCSEAMRKTRQELRECLIALCKVAGYAEETAGPVVSRSMRAAGLALRAQRDDTGTTAGNGDDEDGKPAKQLEFSELSLLARTLVYDGVIEEKLVHVDLKSVEFWQSLQKLATLGLSGKLPSNKSGWAL